MPDVTVSYKGSDILELSDSGSATLKTGGTYCEADIDVEYVKPSGGGWELIADVTTQEDVFAIQVDFTTEMQAYDLYKFVATVTGVGATYPCPQVNATAYKDYYAAINPGQECVLDGYIVKHLSNPKSDMSVKCSCVFNNTGGSAKLVSTGNGEVQYFYLRQYYDASSWKAGSNVKIYGVKLS